ncbi:family 10 glycosylhydrolase [Fodinibius roseus]|nr:family 10 glycosylhydrolase [Fodinibius roseus]
MIVSGCSSQKIAVDEQQPDEQKTGHVMSQAEMEAEGFPEIPREFRGVWVATVANIDWPSEPGLPVDEQKEELLNLLNRASAMNMNAIIFQVRPAADALYNSPYEPWSYFLTGKMGEAPDPYYDPLQYVVDEAHKRGLELHAWFNPYRAGHPADTSTISSDHISKKKPNLVHQFGDYQWLDPGLADVQEHSRRVILDVVERYDIDGVHLDDYFYPYPSYADGKEFPDSLSWHQALEEGTTMSRDDWRRNNVDGFIRQLYTDIKEVKPEVKFGISPFGTWRPGHPERTGGFDAYKQLYADARFWLREGWVDYFSPQLYNRIDKVIRPFPVILQWWSEQNLKNRHIWPGLYTGKSSGGNGWPVEEITGQVYIARGQPNVTGSVHFSMQSMMDENASLVRHLAAGPYAEPALIPASPWLDSKPPDPPHASLTTNTEKFKIKMSPGGNDKIRWWVVRTKLNNSWEFDIVPGTKKKVTLARTNAVTRPDTVVITGVDRSGNESPGIVLVPPDIKKGRSIDKKISKPNRIKRTDWGSPPAGIAANAVRHGLSEGDTLHFRDLSIVLKEMHNAGDTRKDSIPNGDANPDTARFTLHRNSMAEEVKIAEGDAFNWNGYHIGILAVTVDKDDLAGGFTEFEIATVGSLPVARAAHKETGDASQRLRVHHEIQKITLHHSGSSEPFTADEDPVDRLQGLYNWGKEERNWWDVPYHYLIGLDGTIFEGRDSRYAGDTNTPYHTRGNLLISVMGNYNIQEPTQAQIEAITDLMAWSAKKYDLPVDHIYGHYNWADTSCPGSNLRSYLENGFFRDAVEKRLNSK